jgi:hypothetical protein
MLRGPALGTVKRSLFGISRLLHLAIAPSQLPKRIAIFLHAMPMTARESLVAGIEALQDRGYHFCAASEFVENKGDGWAYLISMITTTVGWKHRISWQTAEWATFYCNTIPYDPVATPQAVEAYYDIVGEKQDRTPLIAGASQ